MARLPKAIGQNDQGPFARRATSEPKVLQRGRATLVGTVSATR